MCRPARWILISIVIYIGLAEIANGEQMEDIFLTVSINNVDKGVYRFRYHDGQMLIRDLDLNQLQVKSQSGRPFEFRGEGYRSLDQIEDLHYSIDWPTTTLHIECPVDCYRTHTLSGQQRPTASGTSPGSTGWFVNYELLADVVESRARLGGFAEANLYT